MIKPGAKTKRNADINAFFKRIWFEMNMPLRCERDGSTEPPLDWCHSTRRWTWGDNPILPFECCLLCRKCHNETSREEDGGTATIREIILARGWCFSTLKFGKVSEAVV